MPTTTPTTLTLPVPEPSTCAWTVDAASILWRVEKLTQAGYPDEATDLLAPRGEVDLHQACDILAQGCPVETALRILL